MSKQSSYGQILKSSSVMGGAAGITLLLGMVRTKFAAMLIGTAGVGLLASFAAVQTVIGIFFGFGIRSSAVRDVALAAAKDDEEAIGRAVVTLRRVCWLTGLAGMLAMIGSSSLISQLTFHTDRYTRDVAALGIVILLGNLSNGQMALIQGLRRIRDLALINVLGAAAATGFAVAFYTWLGVRGIVPTLVGIASLQLVLSWYFARTVPLPRITITWRETVQAAGGMVKLGLAFMWSALLASAVSYYTVALVTKQVSLQAVGIYSAAIALSGVFVNFVLSAMEADYYPRLTALAHDKKAINRLVNTQTEVGLLLALPGMLATMTFAPWIIRIFYSQEFSPAARLMEWFILGCFIRVIQWPIGFMQTALRKGRIFFITQTSLTVLHVVLIWIAVRYLGVLGVAVAYFALYAISLWVIKFVGYSLTGLKWSRSTVEVIGISVAAITAVFFIGAWLVETWAVWISVVVTIAAGIYSIARMVSRVDSETRIVKMLIRIPGVRRFLNENV